MSNHDERQQPDYVWEYGSVSASQEQLLKLGYSSRHNYKFDSDTWEVTLFRCDQPLAPLVLVGASLDEVYKIAIQQVSTRSKSSLVDDPNAERVTNEAGGKQSRLDYDLTLIDPIFLQELAKVMTENCAEYGGHYERDNWRKIEAHDHLRHLYNHVSLIQQTYEEVGTDEAYTHILHAACRVMMLVRKWKEH